MEQIHSRNTDWDHKSQEPQVLGKLLKRKIPKPKVYWYGEDGWH